MGFFGKSIKEKILDFALLAINENEPTKDKFLTFYRICQFDLSFDFKSEDEVKFLEKYKNEPIYPEEYNNVKSHLKAIYVVMIEVSLFIARRDKQISEKDYSDIFNSINEELEESDPKAKNLIKYYQEMSDNSRPMISSKLSKESFDNKLTNSLDVLQTWAYISRDGFRMQIEEILGEPLHWAYRS
tara:strand:+ start:92 stop:649 length:558 start_codon:yes stop_codon:yes gene_type:complete